MRTFESQQYEALPVEEGFEKTDDLPTRSRGPRWERILLYSLVAFVALSALVVVIRNHSLVQDPPSPTSTAKHEDVLDQAAQEEAEAYLSRATGQQYLLGVGKADITGPIVELNLMGYASLPQIGTGLRQRLYSRAFIFGSLTNDNDRFVYTVLDIAMGDTAIRYGILSALAGLGSNYSMYNQSNVAITGTHSHSGPGGWLNYLLPQVTNLGFDKQSYNAIVDGTVLSIQRAHASLAPGYLSYADTNITDANINRSLWAYLANPASERAQYDATVDTTLTLLRFQRASDGKNTGVLGWHSVHGTSMLENNTHVTGDNKGVTSYLFEKAMKSDPSATSGFVAAFSQSSVGDTTPNVLGAYCDDGSALECGTTEHSTCNGVSTDCHGRGPKFQALDLGVSSCYEIGTRVYNGAKALYDSFDSVATPVSDPSVKFYHTFHDMSFWNFPLPNGTQVQTCPAAIGYGFAGGTTDGPGAFDFIQGDNSSETQNPFWAAVSNVLTTPTAAQVACQGAKPILLDVGQMSFPYAWSPNIIDVQSFRVGQLIMILSPSEATTMTGRRWKKAVSDAATAQGVVASGSTPKVVLGGPANTYAHYCATPEEYAVQRYEGASTLYGPWESYAYMYLSTEYIGYLAAGNNSQPAQGTLPPNNADSSLSLIAGVVYDSPWIGKSFGSVLAQPNNTYTIGSVVNATFVAANPRNNLRLEDTYAAVQQYVNGAWTTVRDDSDWFLVLTWTRDDGLIGSSHVVISWETESYATAGTYRIVYNGDSKNLFGIITAFSAHSNNFTLT